MLALLGTECQAYRFAEPTWTSSGRKVRLALLTTPFAAPAEEPA